MKELSWIMGWYLLDLIETFLDFIDKVTQKQMSNVANKYFDKDKQYWTIVKPVK